MRLLFQALALLLLASAALPARAQTLTADWAVPCASGPTPYSWGPRSLTFDLLGNSYTAGLFSSTTSIGATTLSAVQTSPGRIVPADIFLAKLDPQGQYKWAVQLGDGQNANVSQVVADNFGNVYMTGNFTSYSLRLGTNGPLLYNSSAQGEGFIASFSALDGHCQWANRFGGIGLDAGSKLVLSATGDLYLAGRTGDGPADFGPFSLPAATAYSFRGFLAKLSQGGTWLWATQLGSNGELEVGGLALDGQGKVYLSGTFYSPGITLETAVLTTNARCGGSASSDVVVAKYNDTGAFKWAVQGDATGANNGYGGALAYDGQGHLFTASYFTSQRLRLGNISLPNASQQTPPPIGPAPPVTCTDRFFADAYAARLDTAGAWQWATRQGGLYDDGAGLIARNSAGQLLLTYNESPTSTSNTQQIVLVDSQTGTWGARYTWPVPVGLVLAPSGLAYLVGSFSTASLTIGGQTVPGAGANRTTGFIARLGSLPLATQPAVAAAVSLQAWPSPGPGTGVWVHGAPARQAVEILDVLGRRVGGGTMPASGPLRLSWPGAGLAPGLYLVRSGGQSCRWLVE